MLFHRANNYKAYEDEITTDYFQYKNKRHMQWSDTGRCLCYIKMWKWLQCARVCVCRGWKQNTICHSLKIVRQHNCCFFHFLISLCCYCWFLHRLGVTWANSLPHNVQWDSPGKHSNSIQRWNTLQISKYFDVCFEYNDFI